MDSIKRLALGTEREAKCAEIAIRFLKETRTLACWKEYTKDGRFRSLIENGVTKWWKVPGCCSQIFGAHNFGMCLKDHKNNFITVNFTVCFILFIFMTYDDDVIREYNLIDSSDHNKLKKLKPHIDLYFLNKEKIKYCSSMVEYSVFIEGFNSLIDKGYIDKWQLYYKRKKFNNENRYRT